MCIKLLGYKRLTGYELQCITRNYFLDKFYVQVSYLKLYYFMSFKSLSRSLRYGLEDFSRVNSLRLRHSFLCVLTAFPIS